MVEADLGQTSDRSGRCGNDCDRFTYRLDPGPSPGSLCHTAGQCLAPKARFASVFGSFGWGGQMVQQLTGLMGNLKVELLDPVLSKGMAREEAYRELDTWRTVSWPSTKKSASHNT